MKELQEQIDSIIRRFSWNVSKKDFIFNNNDKTLRQYHPDLLRQTLTALYSIRLPNDMYVIYTGYDTFENIMRLKDSNFGTTIWREMNMPTFRGIPIFISDTVTKTKPSTLSDIYFINLTNPEKQSHHAKIWDLEESLSKQNKEDILLQITYKLNAIYTTNNLLRSAIGIIPAIKTINDNLQDIRSLFERIGMEFDW